MRYDTGKPDQAQIAALTPQSEHRGKAHSAAGAVHEREGAWQLLRSSTGRQYTPKVTVQAVHGSTVLEGLCTAVQHTACGPDCRSLGVTRHVA